MRSSVGYATAVAGDGSTYAYRIAEIPTNALVRSIRLTSAAQGGSAAVNIGVYKSPSSGGAALDADLFAAGVSVATALDRQDVTNQSGSYDLVKREQPLWQAVGLNSNPGGAFDIVITPTAVMANGGRIGLQVDFLV